MNNSSAFVNVLMTKPQAATATPKKQPVEAPASQPFKQVFNETCAEPARPKTLAKKVEKPEPVKQKAEPSRQHATADEKVDAPAKADAPAVTKADSKSAKPAQAPAAELSDADTSNEAALTTEVASPEAEAAVNTQVALDELIPNLDADALAEPEVNQAATQSEVATQTEEIDQPLPAAQPTDVTAALDTKPDVVKEVSPDIAVENIEEAISQVVPLITNAKTESKVQNAGEAKDEGEEGAEKTGEQMDPILESMLALASEQQAIKPVATTNANVEAQTAAPIAATAVAANSIKPLGTEVSSAEEAPVDEVLASLTGDSPSAAKAKPQTVEIKASVITTSEKVSTETKPNTEKASFDKMLQTLASTSGETAPEAKPAASSQVSSSSPVTATWDTSRPAEAPAARGFIVQTAVQTPVGQPQWSQAVGEKVLWLAAQNVSAAELHLHPKDLGPMQVNVTVNQDQANVTFTSHHPVVREVLDQNLNRLRDMFSEQGLNLVNVDVSDKSPQRQQGDGKHQQGQGGNHNNLPEEEAVAAVSLIKQQRLVDHYA